MDKKYSYSWYIQAFEEDHRSAEEFILSTDEELFIQPPSQGKWSAAECYHHLIRFGHLYLENISPAIVNADVVTENPDQSFRPRWIVQKVISFFAPPYKVKIPTLEPMEPNPASDFNRSKLLEEYQDLQHQFIAQLKKARKKEVHLNATRTAHPIFPFISVTLSECFAVIEVHQRRHEWQARKTLKALKKMPVD